MTALLIATAFLSTAAFAADAPPAQKTLARPVTRELAMESLDQKWRIEKERIFATAKITIDAQPADAFLLLQAPAVLTSFRGDGLRLSKRPGPNGEESILVPERTGRVSATVSYEMPLGQLGGSITIPTGSAAVHSITVELDQAGWGFSSPRAIRTETLALAAGKSGARLVLGLEGDARLILEPKRRDLESETTQFYAETRSLMVPSPGVVDGYHRVTIRPSQGKVSQVEITIPKGFTVGNVEERPVWRFDPESRRLRVQIEPSQSEAFVLVFGTQRSVGGLPFEALLEPVRVLNTSGEVGMLAVGFGADAQSELTDAGKLQAVNLEDFALDEFAAEAGVSLQRVFRYGAEGGTVRVKAVPVAPEVRVETAQTLSLGEERLSLSVDAKVGIARAGIFQLSFPLPEGLELEALTGPSLSHWSEVSEGGKRIIRMHLNGRTFGQQLYTLSFTGPYPGKQKRWNVPRFDLREAERQTGDLLVVPERGIQVRASQRESVSQTEVKGAAKDRPGAVGFRLLQANWQLALGVEELDPWVTAQMLQEVLLREGQTRHRVALRYRVENAAVKALRVRLPGLDPEAARTVRATGRAVNDIVVISEDLWEIRFQRSVIGESDVEIEYQCRSGWQSGHDHIAIAQPENVRQLQAFVAVRGVGRLEFAPEALPVGWQRTDWQTVPVELQNVRERSVPALAFRVTEPGQPLGLSVRRNDVADTLKLTVTKGLFTTVLTPSGGVVTGAELSVSVAEKGIMRVELPKGATLFSVSVNGESAAVVKDGAASLFHVAAGPNEEPAQIHLVYSEQGPRSLAKTLVGPRFEIPLQNIQWDVLVPEGYKLESHQGDLELTQSGRSSSFAIDDYLSLSRSNRSAEEKKATSLIEQANVWMAKGEQDKARKALSQASRNSSLDAASNEDARVQLRELQTRQAVLGLNTRRQKLISDNRLSDAEPVSKAAVPEPSQAVGNAQQFQQALQGNSAEENLALRRMAGRIVGQQLAAEPAPQAIMPTLPKRGEVWSFKRSVQVDGTKALTLRLAMEENHNVAWWFPLGCFAALGGLVGLLLVRRA